jgi:hypothetical protein
MTEIVSYSLNGLGERVERFGNMLEYGPYYPHSVIGRLVAHGLLMHSPAEKDGAGRNAAKAKRPAMSPAAPAAAVTE